MNFKICPFLFLILILYINPSFAQDPARFQQQVDELVKKEYHFSTDKKLVVFAGSSSIRMWKDVAEYFPRYNVINNGFGGSHYSDLLHFYNELILKPTPQILFIYEGDNDISSNKKPAEVAQQAKELIEKVRKDLPDTRIIVISPKPSIARKKLESEYVELNKKLKRLCRCKKNVKFADVWNPMLDKSGTVYHDIFLADGLHMNKKGYDIWGKVLDKYLK